MTLRFRAGRRVWGFWISMAGKLEDVNVVEVSFLARALYDRKSIIVLVSIKNRTHV